MTREAWLGMAEKRAKGMRSIPVICDHPDWWALEGAPMHFIDPAVLTIYWDHKIMQGKEEGDTSQVCQLYDQDPAKNDKVLLHSGVDMLRSAAAVSLGIVDQ